ncbi:protein kinase domain-containing protein [Microbulbifer sp. 2304DJ12-6]|uniref:protein kinase domain-containing protein n=1 Tax=Microbulbifer sp. 2304DJ12-6 TaxID=3233340 RepID=UPI0039AF1F3A
MEKVGCGGMGVVYRARDSVLDRDVALKYINSPSSCTDELVEELIREAKIASSLKHPGIVAIYGFFREGPCIAMEYICGDPLSTLITDGGINLNQIVNLALQVSEALHYAHRSGVVHADLKPSNIMLDYNGRARILDFGLSRWRLTEELRTVSHSGKHLQRLTGTIPYMSPELALGQPIDYRNDIFSLGCILFEMMTGQRPFDGNNPTVILNNLINNVPQGIDALRQNVPEALASLVLNMLEKNLDRRLSSLAEAIVVLKKFSIASPQVREEVIHRVYWRKWVWIGLPLVFVFSIVLAFYWFFHAADAERQVRVFLAQPENYHGDGGAPLNGVIWSSIVNGLHSLGSVQPLVNYGPSLESESLAELAKFAGSDEWILIRYQFNNPLKHVHLQRIRTKDGALLRQVYFSFPYTSAQKSGQAVLSQVLALYNDVEAKGSKNFTYLSFATYQKFANIHFSLHQGVGDREAIFEELMSLIKQSKAFPAAELLAVDLAYDLYTDSGISSYLVDADNLLDDLYAYHPNSIILLQRKAKLAIGRRDIGGAEKVVEELSKLSPGDPEIPFLKSRLAELKGKIDIANDLIVQASEHIALPIGELHRAAALAIRVGDVNSARTYLTKILHLSPGNTMALGNSGLLELLYGDINRAIAIYDELLQHKQHRSYLVNIGLALMLQKKYHEARQKFVHALELQPGSRVVKINLVDVELALGNRKEAEALCESILRDYHAMEEANASNKMIQAQCLAHLGRYERAVAITLKALAESPSDAEIAYQAAVVYILSDEKKSALVCARKALKKGMDRRWFGLPVFANTPVADLVSEKNILSSGFDV